MARNTTYTVQGITYEYNSALNRDIIRRFLEEHIQADLSAWKSNFVAPPDARGRSMSLYTASDWSSQEITRCPYCGSRNLEREPSYADNQEAFDRYNSIEREGYFQADDSNEFLFTRCKECDHIFYTSPVELQNADLRILAVDSGFARNLARYGESILNDAYWAWSIPGVPFAVAEICRHHGLLAGCKPRLKRVGEVIDTGVYKVGDTVYSFGDAENLRRKTEYIAAQILWDVTHFKQKLAAPASTSAAIYTSDQWANWPNPAPADTVRAIDGGTLQESELPQMQKEYGKNILNYMKMYVVTPMFASLLRLSGEPVLTDVNGGLCLWGDLEFPDRNQRTGVNSACFAAGILEGQ